MGNKSSYPEKMLNLKTIADLNRDIDSFNQQQLCQKAMDVLGFLIQFEEVNETGFALLVKNIFFSASLSKTNISSHFLFENKVYPLQFKITEMYQLAELLHRYVEDAASTSNQPKTNASAASTDKQENQQQQQQPAVGAAEQKIPQLHPLTFSRAIRNSKLQGENKQLSSSKEGVASTNPIQNQNSNFNKIDDSEDDNLCPLCFEHRIKVIFPCMHGYCDNCARLWVEEKQKKNCPMCRFEVEATKSRFNRTVTCIEDDYSNINEIVKSEITRIITSKNPSIPIKKK